MVVLHDEDLGLPFINDNLVFSVNIQGWDIVSSTLFGTIIFVRICVEKLCGRSSNFGTIVRTDNFQEFSSSSCVLANTIQRGII